MPLNISAVHISRICVTSLPCQHWVTIRYENNTEYLEFLAAPEIIVRFAYYLPALTLEHLSESIHESPVT